MRRATSRPKMKPPRQPTRHIASKSAGFVSSGGPKSRCPHCKRPPQRGRSFPAGREYRPFQPLAEHHRLLGSLGLQRPRFHQRSLGGRPATARLLLPYSLPVRSVWQTQRRVHDSPRRQLPKRSFTFVTGFLRAVSKLGYACRWIRPRDDLSPSGQISLAFRPHPWLSSRHAYVRSPLRRLCSPGRAPASSPIYSRDEVRHSSAPEIRDRRLYGPAPVAGTAAARMNASNCGGDSSLSGRDTLLTKYSIFARAS
jgi:hypothetical protein